MWKEANDLIYSSEQVVEPRVQEDLCGKYRNYVEARKLPRDKRTNLGNRTHLVTEENINRINSQILYIGKHESENTLSLSQLILQLRAKSGYVINAGLS